MYTYTLVCVYLCVCVPTGNTCSALLLVDLGSWSCGNLTSVGLPNSWPPPLSLNIPDSIYAGFHPFLPLLPEDDINGNLKLRTLL